MSQSPKHYAFTVKVRLFFKTDKELGAIAVSSSISHRKDASRWVFVIEILIGKFWPINALVSMPIGTSDVAALRYKVGDDSMESASFVV